MASMPQIIYLKLYNFTKDKKCVNELTRVNTNRAGAPSSADTEIRPLSYAMSKSDRRLFCIPKTHVYDMTSAGLYYKPI